MKLKKNSTTTNKLRFRLILSFSIGFIAIILGFFSFSYIQQGPQVMGTPKILRHSFLWNEKVWKILQSSKRLSPERSGMTRGKGPRVNGMIGLNSPLKLDNYIIEVVSGDNALKLPISTFKLIPKTNSSTEFKCIEGWSEDISYAGAKFSDFMKYYKVGKKSDGTYYAYVGLETPDGKYYVSLDMESMLHEQTLLTYEMNGLPLSVENGAPLRLLIPIKYGIKSLKRIGKIYFSDSRPRDYWAENGYDWYSGL